MTYDELKELHVQTCQKCLITMLAKNGAYNGYDDALGNFKSVTDGICEAETGLLVRLNDKWQRIKTLVRKQTDEGDEAIVDTIDDAVNYFILLKAIILDKHKEVK